MKNLKSLLAISLCAIFLSVTGFATTEVVKIYVPEDSIEFTNGKVVLNRVILNIDGQIIELEHPCEDDNGFFIMDVINILEDCSDCGQYAMRNGICINCKHKKWQKKRWGR
jgi:hypothetical protein